MVSRRKFLGFTGLAAAWPNAAWTQDERPKAKPKPKPEGVVVNDVHAQLNSTRVYRIVEPQSVDAVRGAMKLARTEKRALCIAGGRHAMGTQQFATDGVLLDIRKMDKVLAFDTERGLIEMESGMQWPQLLEHLAAARFAGEKQWAFNQKPTGADRLTMGGCLSANIHGRGLTMPPFVSDLESFTLIDAKGELRPCSRTENAELFRLAIGGYGLFGVIYSVTLRLVPRRKLQRVVELRTVDEIPGAFAERIRDGFLYGEFQCAIDDLSPDDFLRRGVLSCYRPVPDDTPMPPAQKELTERDWVELLYLAHKDKPAAFQRYAGHYLATNGQLYWSDEQQMSIYPDSYHRALDKRLQSEFRGTESIAEICCERDALPAFMAEVARNARREKMEIISGTLRLIEPDKESFLAWATKPYACVSFNLHIEHTSRGLIRAGDQLRRLIDLGIKYGGSWYPTYHRHALRRQVDACYPQLADFLKLKRKYDPEELFQSDWYRHYKNMFNY